MKNFLKKNFLYILFLLFFIVPLFQPLAFAASSTWNPFESQLQNSIDSSFGSGGLALPSNATNLFVSNIDIGGCLLFGGGACSKKYAQTSYFKNMGLIPQVEQVNLAMLNHQPAGMGLFIADAAHSLGFMPTPVYAQSQGIGFTGFAALLGIWKAFRNVAYVLLSLSIIVVGFMIMFRRKIDPKTVMTIQEALPRIIMTLILITFSYAIAALLIDLLYVVLLVGHGILMTAGLPATRESSYLFGFQKMDPVNTQDAFTTGNLLQAMGAIFPHGLSDFGTLLKNIAGVDIAGVAGAIGAVPGAAIGVAATSLLGPFALLGGVVGAGAGYAVGSGIIELLIGILLAILVLRLFFLFLGAYVQIVLYVLFGPLMILPEVFPGSNAFSGWIRNLIGNLAIFAIAGLMFMVATIFAVQVGDQSQTVWSPPYLTLFGGLGNSGGLAALFTIGILLLIPTLAAQGKQMIIGKDGGGMPIGGAIAGSFAPAVGTILQGYGLWTQHQTSQAVKKQAAALSGLAPQGTKAQTEEKGNSHPPS